MGLPSLELFPEKSLGSMVVSSLRAAFLQSAWAERSAQAMDSVEEEDGLGFRV